MPSSAITPRQRKAALRHVHLARRRALSQDVINRRGSALTRRLLAALPRGARIAAYCPLPDEPGAPSLVAALADHCSLLLLPRSLHDGTTPCGLEWVPYAGHTAFRRGRYGIAEPVGDPLPFGGLDALVVPAVAASPRGGRLGHGAGYYDRALSDSHRPPIIAVVYDDEVVDDLPTEPHDIAVDAVLTENRFIPAGRVCRGYSNGGK